jgi:hypothetical protein
VCEESVAAARLEDRAWSKLRDVVAADGVRRRVGGHNVGVRVRRGMVNIDVMKSLPLGALNRLLPSEAGLRRVSKRLDRNGPKPGEESTAAKQLAVARLHQRTPTSDQSDRHVAQRRCLPRLVLEPARTKEHLGDLTVRCVGQVTVKGA